MINVRTRSCSTVSDLFKDVPDPALFFAPLDAQKDEFLVVVKLFDPSTSPAFTFASCLTIKKESSRLNLLALLAANYPAETNNFYL